MLDTSPEINSRVHQMMKKKSGPDRLLMGCSMFDMAKEIVQASIRAENPDISPEELRAQLFLRFYKNDFSERERERIINHLKIN